MGSRAIPAWQFAVGALIAAGAASLGVQLAWVAQVAGESQHVLAGLGASFGLLALGGLARRRRLRRLA